MSVWDLVHLNLTSPAVLAFALGAIAVVIGTDLRFSEQISAFLSSYLLFAIGFKGGIRLREANINDLWRPTLIVVALGVAIPVIAYVVARRFVKLNISDAAGIAAHYGS
ncbi:MAG: sodium-dependent bicarbonate transport family permease, partial [Actinobacteria bacterium]|nr:sodium-dependent bicarbonate transport family permease [Actinomycetota bacterium]